ncbi:MAG: stage III sporulation protein AC [Clostridia bacterium]|nr:stage III sporulation protein AC [Clostridia bacterium]MBQ8235732.1 stage III sporulation protein AC [Clostridia bacterium]MBQ8399089.1 stage III sporulation protein AC [Clostridia bacterium]
MEITLLLKIIGVGLLIAVANQILAKTGKEDLTVWITVAGIVLVLVMLMGEISGLFLQIRSAFGI